MLRTLISIGTIALLGLFALKLVFGILGPVVGLAFFLLGAALKAALVGAVIYGVVRVLSPDTARRLTNAFKK
jgi:hypothetical protein